LLFIITTSVMQLNVAAVPPVLASSAPGNREP